jgi:hypothetical protein
LIDVHELALYHLLINKTKGNMSQALGVYWASSLMSFILQFYTKSEQSID